MHRSRWIVCWMCLSNVCSVFHSLVVLWWPLKSWPIDRACTLWLAYKVVFCAVPTQVQLLVVFLSSVVLVVMMGACHCGYSRHNRVPSRTSEVAVATSVGADLSHLASQWDFTAHSWTLHLVQGVSTLQKHTGEMHI